MGEGAEEAHRYLKAKEAAAEGPQRLRRERASGEAGGRRLLLGWGVEAAGQTCPVGTEGEVGARRREAWR